MATYGRKLMDDSGNVILPFTRSNFVYMNDNTTLEDNITKINENIQLVSNIKAYKKSGEFAYVSGYTKTININVNQKGIFLVSVSNTIVDPEKDGYGSSSSTITLNGQYVGFSSGAWSGNLADKRVFGSSATAFLIVNPGDKIVLKTLNTAVHSIYTVSALYTGGMDFV